MSYSNTNTPKINIKPADEVPICPISHTVLCAAASRRDTSVHPLGMRTAWFAEIEPFLSAVVAQHKRGHDHSGS